MQYEFILLDPETNNERIPGWYVGSDLNLIDSCDIVLAHQDSYPYVYGMAAEMGYAIAKEKTVIYVCRADRVDSFLSGLARATFTNLTAACNFIKSRLKV